MTNALTLSISEVHPVTLRAALALERAARAQGRTLRWARGSGPLRGPQVRLSLGSLVRPSVVVSFQRPYAGHAAEQAARLALTTAAWDDLDGAEMWRWLSAPLAGLPHVGALKLKMPWDVVCRADGTAANEGAQLHVLGGRRWVSDAVWWLPTARAAAAVLGRAARVLDTSGPLWFDAIRAGIPVATPSGSSQIEDARRTSAFEVPLELAGLVPPSLLDDGKLWRHVIEMAEHMEHETAAPAALMTPEWILRGRRCIADRQRAPKTRWERLWRRYDKLRRDPVRFCRDSQYGFVRVCGRFFEAPRTF